jgi:hypothetical protein
LEETIFNTVPERFAEGVGLYGLNDPAAGADGVELIHEDYGPTEAFGELAGLGEESSHP